MYTCTCILHSHGMLIKDKEELKIDHLRIVSECSGLYKAFSLNSMLSISALILQMNRAVVGVWWGRMAALWLILVCCVFFRVFVWKMCLKEPHIGSLKDLEAFRISKDVTYWNWIANACEWGFVFLQTVIFGRKSACRKCTEMSGLASILKW